MIFTISSKNVFLEQHTIHIKENVRIIEEVPILIINSGNRKVVRTTEVGFRVLPSVKRYFISHHLKLKPFESAFGSLFLLQTDRAYELQIGEITAALHVIKG